MSNGELRSINTVTSEVAKPYTIDQYLKESTMMKYNLFLLIASPLLLQAILSRSICFTIKYDVYIRYSLPAGSPPLNVHCFSGDDSLGYHDLTQNAEYHFDFCENDLASMFVCRF